MPEVARALTLPYAAAGIYRLVEDIRRYPEFLPWCTAAHVMEEREDERIVKLRLRRSGVESSFATRNAYWPESAIEMELLEGPFEHLKGRWEFLDLGADSKVSLRMRYQFSNPLMGFMFGAVVEDIATELVDAFRQRAADVYG